MSSDTDHTCGTPSNCTSESLHHFLPSSPGRLTLNPEVYEGKALFRGQSQVRQGGDWKPHLPRCHAVLQAPDKAREPPAQLCVLPNKDFSPLCACPRRLQCFFGRQLAVFSPREMELTLAGESFVPRSHEARVASTSSPEVAVRSPWKRRHEDSLPVDSKGAEKFPLS